MKSRVRTPEGKSISCQVWWSYCRSGNMINSACYMILQEPVTKRSSITLKISQYSANFSDYWHCGSEDIMILVFSKDLILVISKDHVIKGLCDFMGGSTS